MLVTTDAAETAAIPQSVFALLFGDVIQQITSFPEQIFASHQIDTSKPEVNDVDYDGNNTILPPTVDVIKSIATLEKSGADRQIIINNVSTGNVHDLNSRSVLERILNHVKEAYISGRYEDSILKKTCSKRNFCFCMTYTFQRSGDSIIINFYISRTETAPVWINHANTEVPLTSMSEDEVDLIANAFVRQCAHAIGNYVNLVFNHATQTGIKPNYCADTLPE